MNIVGTQLYTQEETNEDKSCDKSFNRVFFVEEVSYRMEDRHNQRR